MAFIITSPCLGERYAKCADACPVDCIYPGEHNSQAFMVIDPNICIDCGACLHVCPVNAILDRPEKDHEYAKLNAKLAILFKKKPPIPS